MDDLIVEHLEVRYGDLVGVADISLKVPAGKVVALLGSNGAGKTTTLNAIAGVVQPARGKVEWRGETISREPAYAIVGKGLALSPEGWRLFVAQTVEQNLRLGSTALADRSRTAALFERVYALFPRLAERRKQLAGTLSGGERQILVIARALMASPKVLLLDEPSLGLAPRIVAQVMDLIQRLRDESGLTVVLVEQNARSALAIADLGVVLNVGRVVVTEDAAVLAADEALRKHYLGF